ncbi:MAG: hypothetical protein GY948_11760 [Alphaproteobacteria bacterium]|nr:hypothetical protein [Alphaproteobacteria bacterium]
MKKLRQIILDPLRRAGRKYIRGPSSLNSAWRTPVQFDIDAYVATVDGNDPVYQNKMEQRIAEEGLADDIESTGKRRINDYGEIRLLLDSIERNLPWVRFVHLCVHDGQIPTWLRETEFFKRKIIVHEHSNYFDADIRLPTFNSFVIDTQIKNVPGLAEHFIFLDNDMFFPRPRAPQEFFSPAGMPKLNFRLVKQSRYAGELLWKQVYLRENRLCSEAFGQLDRNPELIPLLDHGPLPTRKSVLTDTHKLFESHMKSTAKHSFRHVNDISCYIYRLAQIYSGQFERSKYALGFFEVSDFPTAIKPYLKFDAVCLNDNFDEQCGEEFVSDVTNKIVRLRGNLCELYDRSGT